jgi:hypothetical protein
MASYKSPAIRAYTRRLAVCMVIYTVLIFGVGFLFRIAPPHRDAGLWCRRAARSANPWRVLDDLPAAA